MPNGFNYEWIKRSIIVRTRFEGMHAYKNAPDEVAFLRNMHRHMFHVELISEVFHDDRELEFFIVKKQLDEFIGARFPYGEDAGSCEQIAEAIMIHFAELLYDETLGSRFIACKVCEDGENCAIVSNR